MIQIRNLNIDPDVFLDVMPKKQGKILGPTSFLRTLRDSFPKMAIGSFSHYVK